MPPTEPSSVGPALERISSSPIAWAVAGLLAVGALYLVIRMIEWDLINHQTENQDDPLPR